MNLFTTKKRLREKKKIFGIQVYNNEEAIQELLKEDKITSHLWNKLYKKELWENIYFPEGKTLEDIAVMYKVFERSKKVVYIDNKLYYYRQRGNSILGNINEKLMKDYIEFVQVRYENLKEKYPMLEKEIAYNRINTLLRIHLITVRKKNYMIRR